MNRALTHCQVIFELCFQVIAILSCRCSKPGSPSYYRRINACDRIQTLMSENHHSQIPPLPVVPYAATLSLTGALCVLRDSQKEQRSAQNDAHNDVRSRCQILDSLSTAWCNAGVVARLGRMAFKNLDKTSTRMLDFDNLLVGIDADTTQSRGEQLDDSTRNDRTVSSRRNLEYSPNTVDPIAIGNTTQLCNTLLTPEPSLVHEQFPSSSTITHETGPYLSQTALQNMYTEFSLPTEPVNTNCNDILRNMEHNQTFDEAAFFEGFFRLGMPTSLQDVISDGTTFLNGFITPGSRSINPG